MGMGLAGMLAYDLLCGMLIKQVEPRWRRV